MSWEQLNNAITFRVHYVASKVGKTGLTDVTVDVYNPAGTQVVTGAAATEVGASGVYSYTLAAGLVTTRGEYVAVFKTGDATVDQKHIPSLWIVGRDGDQYLDAAVSSRAAIADYTSARAAKIDNLDAAVSSVAAAVWAYATRTLTSFGTLVADVWAYATRTLTSFGTLVANVWDEALAGHATVGTAGRRLNDLNNATLISVGPATLAANRLSLVRGDSYKVAESRAIVFPSTAWPNLTGATVVMTCRLRGDGFQGKSLPSGQTDDQVIFTLGDAPALRVNGASGMLQTVGFELGPAQTTPLSPGRGTEKYDVQATLSNGDVHTLVVGNVDVTEDQTR